MREPTVVSFRLLAAEDATCDVFNKFASTVDGAWKDIDPTDRQTSGRMILLKTPALAPYPSHILSMTPIEYTHQTMIDVFRVLLYGK